MQISFVHTLRPYLNILIHLIQRSHSAMEAMLIRRPPKTWNTEKKRHSTIQQRNGARSSNNNPQIVKVQQSWDINQQPIDSEGTTEYGAQTTTHS